MVMGMQRSRVQMPRSQDSGREKLYTHRPGVSLDALRIIATRENGYCQDFCSRFEKTP